MPRKHKRKTTRNTNLDALDKAAKLVEREKSVKSAPALQAAVDYDGPRKELFALYLQKAYEQLLTNEHSLSLQDPMLLSNGYHALGGHHG
ncbi:hypothetical protein EB796_020353 [Bugula neritina]|uniref:Uncharacterized protein n=1 Tax=Bugula neritina TaxID=10212 RepID=A0A7J7J5F5_BUGNE|nr:hypothetical protein EB796_020353 [Bugula neritina]